MAEKLNAYIDPNNETQVIVKTRRYIMTHHTDSPEDAQKRLEEMEGLDAEVYDEALHTIIQASKDLPPAH